MSNENNFPTKKLKSERIKIENKQTSIKNKIIEYTNIISESEYFLNSTKLKKEGVNYNNFISELKNILLNLSNCYYNNKEFKECIKINKKILKIDQNYYKSYEIIYKCYCNLGEESNGLIYGSMLKFKCDKKTQETEYKNLIPEIEKKMKEYVEKNKNFSFFTFVKKQDLSQFIIVIIVISYLLYYFYQNNGNKKK